MTASASAIPDEIYYHFAEKSQTVDTLINSLYTSPSALAVEHFKAINSHLKNGQVEAGQLIIVTPPNSQQCSRFEADLMDAAALVDQKLAELTEADRKIMADNYQLLSNIASAGSNGYGATLVYFGHHVSRIKHILQQIENVYVQTYNATGKLGSTDFFQFRKQLFMRLDSTLNSFIGSARMGYTLDQARIKNSLGLNTKSILHQWKQQPGKVTSVPGFAKNYDEVAKLSGVLKGAGYVGIGLNVGQSGIKIHEACTIGADLSCGKTAAGEGGRLVGSIGGGAGSGAVAGYATCSLLLSLPSGGTSLLWCGIVAGIAGGYAGGEFFGDLGKHGGEALYEKIYQ
ncbi:MAG: hypothetical protein L3K25_05540 [Gammaproteobacteria bacterium]|nr:hypothetical protein [Gammaproteobacteria bacterium]